MSDGVDDTGGSPTLSRQSATSIARNLSAIAEPTRIQLLSRIVASPDGRALVGRLADDVGLTQPTVSHHVRIMVHEGLLRREPDGRQVWYSVSDERMAEVLEVVSAQREAASDPAPPVLDRIADDLATRFHGVFSRSTVSRYVRESYTLLAERARITRYLPSLTGHFAGDRLRALARASGMVPSSTPEVLFVCVQNAGRSQLASAILRSLAGDRVHVSTAGSEPAEAIHAVVATVLDEIGVPLNGEYPKPLTDEIVRSADVVITMGCGDACAIYPGRRYLDWDLVDPAGRSLDEVRAVRDEISRRVRELMLELKLA